MLPLSIWSLDIFYSLNDVFAEKLTILLTGNLGANGIVNHFINFGKV